MDDDDTPKTIIMLAVFGVTTTVIMLSRLAMRKYRKQHLDLSDYFTIAAILCLAARIAFTTVVVVWENNNLTAEDLTSDPFGDTEIYQRETGSKLTLVNRIVYNTYIWIQKSVVLLLYRRILNGLPRPTRIIKYYWGFLGATYLVVQIVTFVECHPFYLYWQVVPDPGKCPQAPVQLITFVALNIVTDMGLIILPMPWLFRMKQLLRLRLSLIGLFSIGFLLIAIAFARLPIYGSSTSQVNRNTWGSVEAFAAAFVANVPTLYSLRHKVNSRATATMSQTHRHSDSIGLSHAKDTGITVTNSIELRNDTIDDLKTSHEHQELWNRKASNESLAPSVHVKCSTV